MYLYQIRNLVSGRKYYGITSNYKQRWHSHRQMRSKTPLYDAMRSYGKDNFVMEVIEEGDPEYIAQQEIFWIASDPNCYNLHQGGHIGFDIRTKDAESVEQWKSKLRTARAGRTPAKGMKHSAETKRICGESSKARWDEKGRYPSDVTSLNFKEAKEKYGISKTHYYRLSRRSSNDAA